MDLAQALKKAFTDFVQKGINDLDQGLESGSITGEESELYEDRYNISLKSGKLSTQGHICLDSYNTEQGAVCVEIEFETLDFFKALKNPSEEDLTRVLNEVYASFLKLVITRAGACK